MTWLGARNDIFDNYKDPGFAGCALDFCGGPGSGRICFLLEQIRDKSAAGLKSPLAKGARQRPVAGRGPRPCDSTALCRGRREIEGGFWRLGQGQHGFSLGVGLGACQGRGGIEVMVQTGGRNLRRWGQSRAGPATDPVLADMGLRFLPPLRCVRNDRGGGWSE